MDRNVYRRAVRAPDGYQTDREPRAVERLVKYFPVEGLALYCLLEPSVLAVGGPSQQGLLWAAWGFSLVVSTLYLNRAWHIRRFSHLVVTGTALTLYVIALGGPFAALPFYAAGYALVAAVAATSLMLFVPSPLAPRSTDPGPVIDLDRATYVMPPNRSTAAWDRHR